MPPVDDLLEKSDLLDGEERRGLPVLEELLVCVHVNEPFKCCNAYRVADVIAVKVLVTWVANKDLS